MKINPPSPSLEDKFSKPLFGGELSSETILLVTRKSG
jgi:hypothetical protein